MPILEMIGKAVQTRIAVEGLTEEWALMGENVARWRAYYDGDHDSGYLTDDMRAALRLPDSYTLTQNYIPKVVDVPAARLQITHFVADNEEATAWLDGLIEFSRLDLLQTTIWKAALLESETFLMIGYDNVQERACITHEYTFDGVSGVILIHDSEDHPHVALAVKAWNELLVDVGGDMALVPRTRINMYFPDRIEKYVSDASGNEMLPFIDEAAGETESVLPWVDREGRPLGVPFVPIRNRPRKNRGMSEINDCIPLQDSVNRTASSLLMASEKIGFANRVAIGFDPDPEDKGLAPGDWIIAGKHGVPRDMQVGVQVLEAGDVKQLLDTIRYYAREIGNISGTPAPELFDGDNLSGVAFQAREATLIFKCRDFQVHAGAAVEQALDMAWEIERAFAPKAPPDYARFRARWADVTVSSDADMVGNAVKVAGTGRISDRAFLNMIASAYEWDKEDIDAILAEIEEARQRERAEQFAGLPDFSAFDAQATPGGQR